jgi:hypothetical protein
MTSPLLEKVKKRLEINTENKALAEQAKATLQAQMNHVDAVIAAYQGAIEQLTKVVEEDAVEPEVEKPGEPEAQ